MPIENGAQIYSFPELRKGRLETEDTFNVLPDLLADTLPDRYENRLINAWLAGGVNLGVLHDFYVFQKLE